MPETDPIRVLLLEDSVPLLDRFARIVGEWPRADLVGACETLASARQAIATKRVDILVTDINLPDGNGIDAIRMLLKEQPHAQAVVVSVLRDGPRVLEAIKAGATGYVLKDDSSLGIRSVLEIVMEGKSPMSALIARQIVESIREEPADDAPRQSVTTPAVPNLLSPREREVLTAIARGFTNKEVATLLGISANTIPVHVRNIYRKLDTTNRVEAVYEAQAQGLIDL
ncbi:MAG: response regulator transcription factor [Paracoccaceae bacterium]